MVRHVRCAAEAALLLVCAIPPAGGTDARETVDADAPAVQLIDAAGFKDALAQLRGRVVIVNLWATWCVPCLKEVPELVRLAAELKDDGVTLIGVAMDDPADRLTLVAPFHRKYFPAFSTWQRAESDMDTLVSVMDPRWNEVLPTTYLIGRDGKVAERIQGVRSYGEFRAEVVSLAR
jgi:thiol-disulfide isomerase/thioredoxin